MLYRRLQEHLDRGPVGFPPAPSGVELRILEHLFTPEEAEIALELSAIPEKVDVIHRRIGSRMTLDYLRDTLKHMAEKGVVLLIGQQEEMRFAKLPFVVGMYERQVASLTADFQRDSRQYFDEAFDRAMLTGKTTQMRIVPVNKKIAVERGVSTYDEVRTYVAASPGPFGVIPCICRKGQDLTGHPCRQTTERNNCLMIGSAARWAVDTGVGHEITREEMIEMLDRADREGLVLEPENTKSPMYVCCCCGCCCGVLTTAKKQPRPADVLTSNFYAVSDEAVCESCGMCETRCQMDAISSPEGKAVVDRGRCIGCGLCITTCPSNAMRLEAAEHPKVPPDDTKGLYMKLFEERYGKWGMAKIGIRSMLGRKI